MNQITISASSEYPVLIGNDLLVQSGVLSFRHVRANKVAIISDSNVWPLYGEITTSSFHDAGFQVIHFCFPAGEESKNGNTYLSILNFLAENKLTRSDLLVALGGGVVGDITGFVAATYLRGIHYIQIPTSLLAMVDSSVGGKTAIDLPAGKNLAGAFYQPSLVICDLNALNSLPAEVFTDGCAEVIKYGVLYDESLFAHLMSHCKNFDAEYVVSRCVELKRDVVAMDEFDNGQRQKLNFGHTIGHAIERQSNYQISHGFAVAAGMAIISRAAASMKLCDVDTPVKIADILTKFGLPVTTDYSSYGLLDSALSDKKRSGGTVNLVIPERIGSCILKPTPVDELQAIIEAGL